MSTQEERRKAQRDLLQKIFECSQAARAQNRLSAAQLLAQAYEDVQRFAPVGGSNDTITAREAGVFLPAQRVERKRNSAQGTVIVPSHGMLSQPHGVDAVCVRWDDGQTSWLDGKYLEMKD